MMQISTPIYANCFLRFFAAKNANRSVFFAVLPAKKAASRLCSIVLSFVLAFPMFAQDLPGKIRGYKVYNAEISLTKITLELSAEISGLQQSGRVDFLSFRDFRVNDLPVEVEEYKESFAFEKNQKITLPKPAVIHLGTAQTLRGALREIKESKTEWSVTGRVFVFGKFKKFGFSFKRVVPVEINIKIKNPLRQSDSIKSKET